MEASVAGAFSQEPIVVQSLRFESMETSFPVHVPQERIGKTAFSRPILPAVALFLVLILQVCVRLESMNIGYELHSLRSDALRRDSELRELRLEAARLSAPAEISKKAETKLGLSLTAPQYVRRVVERIKTDEERVVRRR